MVSISPSPRPSPTLILPLSRHVKPGRGRGGRFGVATPISCLSTFLAVPFPLRYNPESPQCSAVGLIGREGKWVFLGEESEEDVSETIHDSNDGEAGPER